MLNYITKIEENRLYFDKTKVKNKKITGTYLAKLCNYSSFDTADSVMLSRLGIYQPQIPEFYSLRGTTLEPIVRNVLSKYLHKDIKFWDPQSIYYDNYQDNKVFGGLKDGQIIYQTADGSTKNIIVEIKTTDLVKEVSWDKEIPVDYYYQAGLYASLDKATDVYFAVGFCSKAVNDKFYLEIKNSPRYRKEVKIENSELKYSLYKLPFDKKYQDDILNAKIVASQNAQAIYDRGYIDLGKLPSKLYEEIKDDLINHKEK